MASRFSILLRRRQLRYTDPETNIPYNIVVQCNPATGFAEYVPGDLDSDWYDFTAFVEGAERLSLTWDKVNAGNSDNSSTNPEGSNYDKGISSDLMFFDDAFKFIEGHLLISECQILNTIEVKIIDLIAGGTYRIFEIKTDNIDEAVDEPCQIHVKLREQDNAWHAIHKTFIYDNWQKWFDNSATKDHPCFLTCIEPRPRLVNSARMAFHILLHANPISSLVNSITDSDKLEDGTRKILNATRFVDSPLIRTYLENVATKCGLHLDTMFNVGQPFENLCMFDPQAGFMHEYDKEEVASPDLYYHYENRRLWTAADLLDKLKPVFAAEWYVTPNNTIVFKHTKDLIQVAILYDFTLSSSAPIYDLRYTFSGEKKPAYGRYEYQTDGSDLASQEISTLYNDIIDYDGPANNPMLEGERTKNFEFAPTGFVRDGRSKDYMSLILKDGRLGAQILLLLIGGVGVAMGPIFGGLVGGLFALWFRNVTRRYNTLKDKFVNGSIYTGAVRLTSDQVLAPRLILWDGQYLRRAKAVSQNPPSANTYFNPTSIPYNVKNNIYQDNSAGKVYNYPLYFDADFTGNLFDLYHDEIDNPLKSKESHREAKFNIDLCEDMLKLFGVFENQYAVIGKVVKIQKKDNYDVYMRIGNIQVDYDSNKINLKGKILRRA